MTYTNADTAKLAKAAEADARIRQGDHFHDWLSWGIGLTTLRDIAMRDAHTNTPQGRTYNVAIGRLMEDNPWAKSRDNATKSAAMWLADNMAVVIGWRETLAQNQREQVNHPQVVKRNFLKATAVKEPKPEKQAQTPYDRIRELQGQLAEVEERNAHLEGKVDGGSFDIERDSFEDIKAVIDRLPHKSSLKTKMKSVNTAIAAWLAIPAKR
jgi:hypothetical protein